MLNDEEAPHRSGLPTWQQARGYVRVCVRGRGHTGRECACVRVSQCKRMWVAPPVQQPAPRVGLGPLTSTWSRGSISRAAHRTARRPNLPEKLKRQAPSGYDWPRFTHAPRTPQCGFEISCPASDFNRYFIVAIFTESRPQTYFSFGWNHVVFNCGRRRVLTLANKSSTPNEPCI